MATVPYDPKKCKISWGIPLDSGIADGTFIKASRDSASTTKQVGSDGSVVFSRSHDHSGKAELTIQRASAVNAYLSAQLKAWEAGEGGMFPFFVADLNGASLVMAPNAVLEKPADFERGKEHSNVTWTFLLDDVEIVEAGMEA